MTSLPDDPLATAWRQARSPSAVTHIDTASAGRTSIGVRERMTRHLNAEAETGGYVAADAVSGELRRSRHTLGSLLGVGADDVAYVESGSAALAQLLSAWPAKAGDTVWCAPSDWGANLFALAQTGLRREWLTVAPDGVIDVGELQARLRQTRPAFVHVTAAAAHRSLVQPLSDISRVCGARDVPVVVDVAQALGQIDIADAGAAAYHGTGRKWLAGPRGVGFLAVTDRWQDGLTATWPAMPASAWPGETGPVRRLESREANIAGRVGLATALEEYTAAGPDRLRRRLDSIGTYLRQALGELGGWKVADTTTTRGALVGVASTRGSNPDAVRAQLLTSAVVVTAAGRHRAPHDMPVDLLRLSPHVDSRREDLDAVVRLLSRL